MQIPTELINLILGKLYYKDYESGEPDYHVLCACSLISTVWREPAQRLLFRFITLRKCHAFSLAHIGHKDYSPHVLELFRHVRILEVGLVISKDLHGCTADELSLFLLYCTNLYEIRFHVQSFFSFNGTILSSTQTRLDGFPPSLKVQAIRLYGSSSQSPILYELLKLFPDVKYLTIGTEIISDPPQDASSAFHLYELVLHRNISVDVFNWLLSTSISSLRILELRDLPNPLMNPTLFSIAPTLRSLRLLHYTTGASALVRACLRLEELILMNFPTFLPFPELPSTLEHFGFMNISSSSSDTLFPVIQQTNKLLHLRMITCSDDSRQHLEFPSLQNACSSKGIQLVTRPKRLWTMEDPLPVKSFPRIRSISNFFRMHKQ